MLDRTNTKADEKLDRTLVYERTFGRNFTIIPNSILETKEISLGAKVIYALLLRFAWQNGEAFPGHERLAEAAGCSKRSVQTYLNELRRAGLITWKRRGAAKTNMYQINGFEVPVDYLSSKNAALQEGEPRSANFALQEEQGSLNSKICTSRNAKFALQEEDDSLNSKICTSRNANFAHQFGQSPVNSKICASKSANFAIQLEQEPLNQGEQGSVNGKICASRSAEFAHHEPQDPLSGKICASRNAKFALHEVQNLPTEEYSVEKYSDEEYSDNNIILFSNSSLRSELENKTHNTDCDVFDDFGEIEVPDELFEDGGPVLMCINDTEESSGTDAVLTETPGEASTNPNAHACTSNVTECSHQPNTRARTSNVTECSHESFKNFNNITPAQGKTYRSLSGCEERYPERKEQYPEGYKNHLRSSESTGYPLPDAVEPKKNNTSAGIKNKASSASKEVLRSGPTSSDTEDSLNKTPGEGNTLPSNAGPWGKENIDFSPGANKNNLISSGDRTDIRNSSGPHGRPYENTLSGANSNKTFSTGSAVNERRTDELRNTFEFDTPSGVDSIELISTGTPDNAPVEEGPNRTENTPADALDKAPSSGVTTDVREPDIHREISGKPVERVSSTQDGTTQMQAIHPGISLRTADIIAMLGDSLREVMDPPAKAYAIAGRLYNLYDFPAAEAAINALRRKIEQGQKVKNPVAYLMKVARLKKQEFETGETEDDDDELKLFSEKYPEEHRKRLEEVKRVYAERQKHLEEYLACSEAQPAEVEGFKSPIRALLGPG